jgi:hypothetical protein
MVHRPVCLVMLGGVALFGGEDSLRHPATPSQICSTSPVALARNPSFSSFLPTLNPAVPLSTMNAEIPPVSGCGICDSHGTNCDAEMTEAEQQHIQCCQECLAAFGELVVPKDQHDACRAGSDPNDLSCGVGCPHPLSGLSPVVEDVIGIAHWYV